LSGEKDEGIGEVEKMLKALIKSLERKALEPFASYSLRQKNDML
jgi:hypothetical protein